MSIVKQITRVAAGVETSTRAREFCQLARVIALGKEHQSDRNWALSPVVRGILSSNSVYNIPREILLAHRAAAAAGTTTDATWAAPLADYQVLANAFLESLRAFGAFDRMLPSMRQVPLRTRIGAVSVGITGTTVGQGQSKPISRLTLTGTQIDELKAVAVLIITQELARFSSVAAGDLFSTELSNAVAVETDETFVSILIAGATSFGSSGSTAEHVRNDLRALLASVTTSARSALFLLMPSAIAKVLSILHTTTGDAAFPGMNYNGGTIAGMTAVVSEGVPTSTIVCVDAQQVAAASDTINLDQSDQASIQLDTAPDSPPTASTNMYSFWPNNAVGLKAERVFGAQKLTTTGVAVLTGANYLGDSPGP